LYAAVTPSVRSEKFYFHMGTRALFARSRD
jgi:hypothetical protein